MPYINSDKRRELIPGDGRQAANNPGELNYLVTKMVLGWVDASGPSYATYNAAVGALECAKLELYRRAVAAYEDEKILLNGDVFD